MAPAGAANVSGHDTQQIQEEELQAMRAIFGEDWQDIPPEKTAWGTAAQSGWWQVRLKAHEGKVGVTLKGKFLKTYPLQPPSISLSEPLMLSGDQVHQLTRNLQAYARQNTGREMIFDLTELIIEFLEANHLPLPHQNENIPTLMEEKAKRDADKLEQQRETQKRERERLDSIAEQENAKLAARIHEEHERRASLIREAYQSEKLRLQREEDSAMRGGRREKVVPGILSFRDGKRSVQFGDSPSLEDSPNTDCKIEIPGYSGYWPTWNAFGPPIRKESFWTAYEVEGSQVTIPHSTSKPTGHDSAHQPSIGSGNPSRSPDPPVCSLVVIDFLTPYYENGPGRRKVEKVFEEISTISRIKHANLVEIYATKLERLERSGWRLYILEERYTAGGTMSAWLQATETFTEDVAVGHLRRILEGVNALHVQGSCHKNLCLESILISLSDPEHPTLRLSGASFVKLLLDMNKSNPFTGQHPTKAVPDIWLSPEELESPYLYKPERDMWHVGLCFLQMLYGRNILLKHPNLKSIIDDADYEPHGTVLDVLRGLLDPRPQKRLTAREASQKIVQRSDGNLGAIAIRPGSLTSPASNSFFRSPVTMRGFAQYFDTSASQPLAPSRYRNDFEEVEWLGEGGFGQVVKARHRIEKQFYAIKKIKLHPEDDEQKVFREAESLSRVNHRFIVRYIQCWMETSTRPGIDGDDDLDYDMVSSQLTPTVSKDDDDDIFGPPDFDDLSSANVSHSKSFPRIRFANSSDDESETSDDQDSSANGFALNRQGFGTRHKSKSPKARRRDLFQQRTLYIQMEYVEKQTLKEILEALAYLAKLHIVHRDLKPSNILLDSEGNVKLCDFGLSTTDNHLLPLQDGINLSASFTDMTSGVGTHLYVSPDVIQNRTYGTKADLYSLGIIFFEMCYPMKSGMERVQVLSNLRLSKARFPSDWSSQDRPAQTQIIEWLLRHDPEDRPEAEDLLRSPLLPEGREEGYYAEAIRKVAHASSVHYPALIARLFNPERIPAQSGTNVLDYTYDSADAYIDESQAWTRVVKNRLSQLFERHGAIELSTPLLAPALLSVDLDQSTSARLLDSQGNLVQLPSDGMVAFARYVGIKGIERIKRYQFGSRYSDSAVGGQPRAVGEVNYDLISPSRTMVSEAEAIEVVDKLINEFQALGVLQYEIHISHESILSTILSTIPTRERPRVDKIISDYATGSLGNGLSSRLAALRLNKQQADALQQCLAIDELPIVRKRLLDLFPAASSTLASAFAEIDDTIRFARALGVTRPMFVRPAMPRRVAAHRRGITFECVRREKRKDVIALGGRYDELLERFSLPTMRREGPGPYGVGLSILIDRIAYHVGRYESAVSKRMMSKETESERSFGYWSPSRCDVYVASFGPRQLESRLDICGELWRAGISADLQYDDDRTLEDVVLDCQAQNILYVLIPRPNRPFIKIRSILRRSEEEVSRPDLTSWLGKGIAEQRRIDLNVAQAETVLIEKAHPTVAAGDSSADGDIRILLRIDEERKTKRNAKSMFTEKVRDFIAMTNTHVPVFGLDLPARILAQLCLQSNDWLTDDEAWKATQSILATDRAYALSVRHALQAECTSKGSPFVFLYSLREGKASLLSTQR